MAWFLTKRFLWMIPTLVGISLLTFVLLDQVPADRASLSVGDTASKSVAEREAAVLRLRIRFGLVDPEPPHEAYSVWLRYGRWVAHAVQLDFAATGEDPDRFRRRFLAAASLSAFLGALAVLLSFLIGVPLGRLIGLQRDGPVDRSVSAMMLAGYGMPEVLLATLLLLMFSSGWLTSALPTMGLHSNGSENWGAWARLFDFGSHLVLPVAVMTMAPTIEVTRFVRESVSRAAKGEYVLALRGWGMPDRLVQRRIVANGRAPIATLIGSMLPIVITGSVIVESVFTLPGMGLMSVKAILAREPATVMATTLCVAVVTLIGFTLSDVLHRVFDPRVGLS